jgi:hypothetical protein
MKLVRQLFFSLKYYTILTWRGVKFVLKRRREKVILKVKPTAPILFRKSFVIFEFETKGILYITSKPGYKSIDLNRMYIDLSKVNTKEIVITGHSLFKKIDHTISLEHLQSFEVQKAPSKFSKSLADSQLNSKGPISIEFNPQLKPTKTSVISKKPKTTFKPAITRSSPILASWRDLN